MKYVFKNLILQSGTVPMTARSHQGEPYSWITAELFNESDPFGNPARLPRFYILSETLVTMFKPYCEPLTGPNVAPGTLKVNEVSINKAIAEGTCPDIMHISNVFMVEWPLAEPYVRLDRASRQPVTNKDGRITPVQSLTLYLKKTFDPDTNEWQWVEAPADVARRVLERSYQPANTIQPSAAAQPAATEPQAPAAQTAEQIAAAAQAQVAALTGAQPAATTTAPF